MRTKLLLPAVLFLGIAAWTSAAWGSEEAYSNALAWLAKQQRADGSWSFGPPPGTDAKDRPDYGTLTDARNGATALALLPFLNAGQSHKYGKFREVVGKGLKYLMENIKMEGKAGSLEDADGGLYSHAWATLALCDAYAMTHDKGLLEPAQAAINHIAKTQDEKTGGWRFKAGRPCNLALTGWMVMALKGGHLAYLEIPPKTVAAVPKFLDSMQTDKGAKYGYTKPGEHATAVGLLCRAYLGWKHHNPHLKRGVVFVSEQPLGKGDLLRDYCTAMLFSHLRDDGSTKWRQTSRDALLKSQAKTGRETGSWFFRGADRGSRWGGRLYCTVMAAMTLDCCIRDRWPLKSRIEPDDFPL